MTPITPEKTEAIYLSLKTRAATHHPENKQGYILKSQNNG
jgi:hypothetical protein